MVDPTRSDFYPQFIAALAEVVTHGNEERNAEVFLRSALDHPRAAAIPHFLACIGDVEHVEAHVRQLAAVLLRRYISISWIRLGFDEQEHVKQHLLELVARETQTNVRNSVAALIAMIAKHEVPAGQWNALLQSMMEFASSSEAGHREVAMVVLYSLTETISGKLRQHLPSIVAVMKNALSDTGSVHVQRRALRALSALVPHLSGEEELASIQQLVEPALLTLENLLLSDGEDTASDIFTIFFELIEKSSEILVDEMAHLLKCMSQVALSLGLSLHTRDQASSVMCWISRYNPRLICSSEDLLRIMFETAFSLLQEPNPSWSEGMQGSSEVETLPYKIGGGIIDCLSIHLPSKYVYGPVMQACISLVQTTLPDGSVQLLDPSTNLECSHAWRAALHAVRSMSEGCTQSMIRDIEQLLDFVSAGITQPSVPFIREEACECLAEFSDQLVPNIFLYHSTILEAVTFVLLDSSPVMKTSPVVRSCLHIIGQFCEALNPSQLRPYLDTLMNSLLGILESGDEMVDISVRKTATRALASVIIGAQDLILPFYDRLMQYIDQTLSTDPRCFSVPPRVGENRSDETATDVLDADALSLRAHCCELAAFCANAVGPSIFTPETYSYLREKIIFAFRTEDEPELREYAFAYFANISESLPQSVANDAWMTIMHCLDAIESDAGTEMQNACTADEDGVEGVLIQGSGFGNSSSPSSQVIGEGRSGSQGSRILDLDFDDDDDGDDDGNGSHSDENEDVSNAYTDEKAAAIHCLGELAFQCALFYPKEIPSDTDITSYASMLFDANVSGEIPLVWEWPCLSMFIVHAVQLLSQHGLDHYHYSVRRNTCRTLARLFLCCPLPSQTLSEMKESGQVLMPGDPHSQLFSFVAPRVRHLLCRCAMEDGHPLVAASAVQSLAEIVECRASDENTESVATGARSSRIAPLAYPASAIRSVFVFDGDENCDGVHDLLDVSISMMNQKTACQKRRARVGEDDDADHDFIAIDSSGELLASLSRCLSPESFGSYFDEFYSTLLKLMSHRSPVESQVFAIGCLTECIQGVLFPPGAETPEPSVEALEAVKSMIKFSSGSRTLLERLTVFISQSDEIISAAQAGEFRSHSEPCSDEFGEDRALDNVLSPDSRISRLRNALFLSSILIRVDPQFCWSCGFTRSSVEHAYKVLDRRVLPSLIVDNALSFLSSCFLAYGFTGDLLPNSSSFEMYLASLPLREDAEEHRTVSPALLALLQTTECSEVMFAPSHLPYVVAELASGVAEAEFQYSLQEASHAITLSLCQSYVQAHNFDPSVLIPLRGAFRPFGVDAGDISIAGTIKGALSQFFALYGEHARLAASHSIDLLRSLHERYPQSRHLLDAAHVVEAMMKETSA